MKKLFLLLWCLLLVISLTYAELPLLEKGKFLQYPLDKNGKTYLDICLQDVLYSDSTERSCIAWYTFRVTSVGVGTAFGNISKLPKKTVAVKSPYFMKYTGASWVGPIEMFGTKDLLIPKDSSALIQYRIEYIGKMAEFYVNAQKVASVSYNYDNSIALRKLAEKKRKLWKEEKFASISQGLDINIAEQGNCGTDTLFLYSSKMTPFDTDINRYYIIYSNKMMVTCTEEKLQYRDTFYFDKMPEFLLEDYQKEVAHAQRFSKLRSKNVSEIDAREVFDYFPRGTDIVEFTKLMGKKNLAVTPCCYETTFYDKLEKKDILFQFTFSESGKLSSVKRESTNTMPSNDVWSAFMILETVESFRDLSKALEILRKDKKNTSTKR